MTEMDKNLARLSKKIDMLQTAMGRIERRQIADRSISRIAETEFKAFSQWGEDGIIQYLIRNIEIKNKIFVEFGVENYTEANTRFLLINDNWSGLVIDGSQENVEYIKNDDIYWRYNLKAECSFITAENIDQIMKRNGICGEIGLLSIDIDGNDYWVWKSIEAVRPAIVIVEYNHRFGRDKAVTIPYDPMFQRTKSHYSNIYYGASIQALTLLAKEKGYALVAGNSNGNNLFFVKNSLLNDSVRPCAIEDAFCHAGFRESRDRDGVLNYLSLVEEQKILEGLPLINLEG